MTYVLNNSVKVVLILSSGIVKMKRVSIKVVL